MCRNELQNDRFRPSPPVKTLYLLGILRVGGQSFTGIFTYLCARSEICLCSDTARALLADSTSAPACTLTTMSSARSGVLAWRSSNVSIPEIKNLFPKTSPERRALLGESFHRFQIKVEQILGAP